MTAIPAPRPGWELLAGPGQVNQRRYEALRAYLHEGATLQQAAGATGYTRAALASLVRDLRAGRLTLFAPPGVPGRKSAPKKDAARGRVIELRRDGLSAYEISARLGRGGTTLGRSPARLGLPGLVKRGGYPGTRKIPAASYLLSLLALKLTATRRVSHVDDLLCDPAPALLAGLLVLPKKTALTDYSYRLSHDHQRAFLAALDQKMIAAGLATSEEAIFDLDFHAVMHWGADPDLEKHYVPTRSQRSRSVLTFFAQDSGTHNLVYANADLTKATQHREVIAFCDHWKTVSGSDPKMLIMNQKVTTQAVLGELDTRGVKFATLRMRSPALISYINGLTGKDFKQVILDRPGRYNKPRVHEDDAVKLSKYPGTVRQL